MMQLAYPHAWRMIMDQATRFYLSQNAAAIKNQVPFRGTLEFADEKKYIIEREFTRQRHLLLRQFGR